MNLLEHYILDVIKVEKIDDCVIDIINKKPMSYYKVLYKVDCYGTIENKEKLYNSKEEYEQDIKRGYYMAWNKGIGHNVLLSIMFKNILNIKEKNMKIEIVGKGYDVGEKLTNIIESKIGRFDRYFEDAGAKIYCTYAHGEYKMEVNIFAKNMFYRAEVKNRENMYANIDLVLPKIERQIVKNKDKFISKLKANAFDFDNYEFIENYIEDAEREVARRKVVNLGEPISVEDAKRYIEMEDHNFYIYKDKESGRVCVLYKRGDSENVSYGVIEVED